MLWSFRCRKTAQRRPQIEPLDGLIAQAEAKSNYAIALQRQARREHDPVKRARLLAQAATIYAQCDRIAARAYRDQ